MKSTNSLALPRRNGTRVIAALRLPPCTAVLALLCASALSARAQLTYYNAASKATFMGYVAANPVKVDFENAASKTNTGTNTLNTGIGYLFSNANGFVDQGVQFVGNGIDTSNRFGGNSAPLFLSVASGGYYTSSLQTNFTHILQGPNQGATEVTWPGVNFPVTAVGLDLGNLNGGGTISVTVYNGSTPVPYTFNASAINAFSFFGVISATPITKITFAAQNGRYAQMDNFCAGKSVATVKFYTERDRPYFEDHTICRAHIDFENAASKTNTGTSTFNNVTGYLFSSTNGFVDLGVKFFGNGKDTSGTFGANSAPYFLGVAPTGYYTGSLQSNGTSILQGPNMGSTDVSWPSVNFGVTAVGLDLGNLNGSGTIFVTLSNGATTTFTASTINAFSFFGVTSNLPFAWISFTAQNGRYVQMDNVCVGQTVNTVNGVVDWGATQASSQAVNFEFRPADGSPSFLTTAAVPPSGEFSVSVPSGQYTAHVKSDNRLAVNADVDTTSDDVTLPSALVLRPGDANNDNCVDVSDFAILVNSYSGDITLPDSGYNPQADFNGDGLIDIADFALLIANYSDCGDM